jgi:phosphoribosylanthranilate isomerase
MTWIKICGMTNLADALVAVEAGADAVGFVFYEKSPRYVSAETVREIVEKLPAKLEKVGVFVNETENLIGAVADRAMLTAIQMHGDDEDPHVADIVVGSRPHVRILAAISMQRPRPEGWAFMWNPNVVHAFLVDSGSGSQHGGTGRAFDWAASAGAIDEIKKLGRLALAGGLTPDNVAGAISIVEPWGVDVASGVEASPGRKDPEKVRAFVNAVRAADKPA